MRKGILSFSPLGRKKVGGKPKTSNMEQAEKASVKKAVEVAEPKPATPEKAFVQTIRVPVQRKLLGKKKSTTAKARRTTRRK